MNEAELSEGPMRLESIVDSTLFLRYVETRTQSSISTQGIDVAETFESTKALLRTPSRERSRA